MADSISVVDLLRATAMQQATTATRSVVKDEDILIRIAQFVNSDQLFASNLEKMWSSKPASLGTTRKRFQKVIDAANLTELVVAGYNSEHGVFLVKMDVEETDENSDDSENSEDEVGVEVVAN